MSKYFFKIFCTVVLFNTVSETNFLVYLLSFSVIIDWTRLIVSEFHWVTGWPDLPLLRLRRVHSFCHLIMSCWMVLLAGEKPLILLNFLLVAVSDLVRIISSTMNFLCWAVSWGILISCILSNKFSFNFIASYRTDAYIYDTKNKTSKYTLSIGICFKLLTLKEVMTWENRLLFCGPPCT